MDAKAFLGRGWDYPVQITATDSEVALVEFEEDVRQAVRIILETGHGERVMRPEFGAGLHDFVFEPVNTTTLALIKHRVEEALITWEPRIRVEQVEVQQNTAMKSRVDIELEYRVRATNTFYNLVVPFYLQEGAP